MQAKAKSLQDGHHLARIGSIGRWLLLENRLSHLPPFYLLGVSFLMSASLQTKGSHAERRSLCRHVQSKDSIRYQLLVKPRCAMQDIFSPKKRYMWFLPIIYILIYNVLIMEHDSALCKFMCPIGVTSYNCCRCRRLLFLLLLVLLSSSLITYPF
jgi:hypothetical protein